MARAAVIAAFALLLHSLVDYPLRTYPLLLIFGILVGMIWAADPRQRAQPRSAFPGDGAGAQRRWPPIAVVITGMLAGGAVLIQAVGDARMPSMAGRATGSGTSAQVLAENAEKLEQQGDLSGAEGMARRSLEFSLNNARAIRVFAVAAQRGGKTAIADTAFVLAGRLGWRDGFAHMWLLDRALAQREYPAAALSGDALLRTRFHPELVLPRLATLIESPEGRAALADRMATDPPWASEVVGDAITRMPAGSAELTAFMSALGRAGVRLSPRVTSQFFESAIAGGGAGQAIEPWQQLNRSDTQDPSRDVVDGDFDQLAAGIDWIGPFGWRVPDRSELGITTPAGRLAGSGPALRITVRGDARGGIAVSQRLLLLQGRYELSYLAEPGRGSPTSFRVSVRCGGRGRWLLKEPLAGVAPGNPTRTIRAFDVPTECPSQELDISASPAFGDAEVSVDMLHVRSIGSTAGNR